MARVAVSIDTKLAPQEVVAALTDFSDRRPDIWPGLARSKYKVYSVGENSAEVQEGNEKPDIRAREPILGWEVTGAGTVRVRAARGAYEAERLILSTGA